MKITSRSSLILCTSDSTPKLKQTWLNLANDDFIPSKAIRTQTEQLLELFCRTFSCFVPYRCENIIEYYWSYAVVLTECTGLNKLFLHLMRALCFCVIMISYLVFFIFILLIRNHVIFLVQFGIHKHLLIFSKTTNCTRPTGSCNFVSLWKNLLVLIYSKLHSKSCDYLY